MPDWKRQQSITIFFRYQQFLDNVEQVKNSPVINDIDNINRQITAASTTSF